MAKRHSLDDVLDMIERQLYKIILNGRSRQARGVADSFRPGRGTMFSKGNGRCRAAAKTSTSSHWKIPHPAPNNRHPAMDGLGCSKDHFCVAAKAHMGIDH